VYLPLQHGFYLVLKIPLYQKEILVVYFANSVELRYVQVLVE